MFEHHAPERYGRYKGKESSNDHQPEDLMSGFSRDLSVHLPLPRFKVVCL